MPRAIVLGGGRVGGLMARDLDERGGLDMTVADVRPETLARLRRLGLATLKADLSDAKAVAKAVKGFDVAVGAVPGFMGYATMRAVVGAGVDYADISFMPEDFMRLDGLARKKGVTAVPDCGVAPGLSNMMVGRSAAEMESVDRVVVMVGGLPRVRHWPYEYKAGFSPVDVIEEYTRPARLVRGGRVVTEPALSGVELVHFPGVGTLEAFNTDGLRSLLRTIKAREMSEMTLRYPGHAEKMLLLRETGFFGEKAVDVKGAKVRPVDLTARLLFPLWEMGPGDEDMTVMRVVVEGAARGRPMRHSYHLLDNYDRERCDTSMARTTGFTNSIVAAMVARGQYKEKGVAPPERIGTDRALFEKVLAELRKRGVHVVQEKEKI